MHRSLLLALALLAASCFQLEAQAQQPMQDVVYLLNGSVIRGTILEQDPNESLRIQTIDGSVFVYRMDEVERITREPSLLRASPKSPGIALALALGPGLVGVQGIGQWYNGEIGKGFLFFVPGLVGLSLGFSDSGSSGDAGAEAGIGAAVWAASLVWSSIDAYQSAGRINRESGSALSQLRVVPSKGGGLALAYSVGF